MNRKITKLGSWLLAFALLLSSMLPITASAASGVTMDLTNCHVSWDYTLTDEDGNAFTAAYGVSAEDNPFGGAVSPAVRKMHDYTAKRNGLTGSKADWTYGADYVYCFCIEHGVPLPNNYEYAGSSDPNHGNKYRMLSNEQKDLLALALTYGYPNRVGLQTSKDANACYAATQLIVWQITLGFRTSPTELNDKSYPVSGYSGTMTEQHCRNKYFKAYYDAILADMASHYIRPSFAVNYAGAAPVYEMEYANGKYTLTLTDANGILSKYYVSQSSGVSVSVSGNTLTLTSSKPINDAVTIKLNRQIPVTTMSTGFLIWSVPGKEGANQDMVSGVPGENDPVPSFLKVRTAAGSAKIVKTSEDGKVDGIAFTISGNGVNQTVTTNNRGEIRIDGLRPGVYTVTEQSYDKYEPQEVRRVTVVSGQVSTVIFNNKLKRGSLEVMKTSEDHLIEGVKFHLSGTSLSGLPVDEYAVTDSTGKAVFSDVLIGTGYVLSEVDTDVRYVIPEDQTAAVEWNKVTHKSIHNVLKKWNATVTKSDSTTGTPQGDAKLSGAVYGVYKGGQLVDTYVTDGNGQFTTVYYACGDDWTIREITPSEGYLLDGTVYPVGAEPQRYTAEYNSTALDVTEQIAKGNIAIIKHTDDGSTQLETPEAGAKFAVYLKSAGSYDNARDTERDHLVCDENGFAQTKDLPYGVYVVHQTEGWEGRELLPDFEVYIAEDGKTYRYLANNRNFESYVKVIKVDAETGKTIPLAGASFRLYDPDGQLITMTYTYPEVTVIDTFTTSADGMLITPEKLPYGKGYSLEEVSAPYGYVLSSERVYFDITADNATEESAVTVVAVTKENTAQKGIIQITKTGEVFATVTESDGVYRPVYAVQMLPGAVYKITAAEDIITPDGTLRYAAGTVVDTVTTTADAPAGSKPLYLGKYAIREITVPYGMVLSSEVRTVELTYAGQLVEVTETAASFYNERQKAAVDLTKIMAQDEIFGITGADEIGCVTFGLYAAEAMTAADGSVIPAGGLLETVTVGADGKAAFATDLPVGSKAYVQEIATGSHYILSDRKYPVVFDYAGESVALVHLAVNDGQPIENELIYGEIHGLKKDEDGKGLGGALIGLFRADCTEFTRENALLTATSAEDGSFSFICVPYGNWLVREIGAPAGFVLTEECFPVTVNENGAVIEVEIENRSIRGTVALSKVDKDYPENKLEGAVFEVYRDSNGNKEFDAEDELLGTMDELGRGEYAMSELRYGGYFLKEKAAPDGFYPDENAYYFEITADGETVTVENEAGKGFINAAQVGSLRIIKTSSDGKLAGFSFRITSANGYDQVFKTDENGVILIEGLRVGDYTVSEETDGISAGYILPADKTASVFEGAVTKVEMHNEKKPDEPKAPQTGDNSHMALWLGLLGASSAAIVAIAVTQKRRKEDAE